jgi:uncharacterized protein
VIVVVLDTNTLVSGFGWSGPPSVIVDAVLAGELLLVSSQLLLDELDRVLKYPKLARVFLDPGGIVERVRAVADLVEAGMTLSVVDDGPDNRVLEAAVEARVDAIVTGARGLLDLVVYDGIPIMSSATFVDWRQSTDR